jgi:hypothetical protein
VAKNEDGKRRRTRVDPPELGEAITAAQSITSRIDGQVEIAAKLMGMPEDEVKQAVLRADPLPPAPVRRSYHTRLAQPIRGAEYPKHHQA